MTSPLFSSGLEDEKSPIAPSLDQSSAALAAVKYNPRPDAYAFNTQRIANKLPEWNKIRRRKQSYGQNLINAIYGHPLDKVEEQIEDSFRERSLQLSPLDQPDLVVEAYVPDHIDLGAPPGIQNFIPNSNFQIWSYPHQLPDKWIALDTSNSQTYTIIPGLHGHNSLRVTAPASQSASVYIDIDLNIPAGQVWSISGFCRHFEFITAATTGDKWGLSVEGLQVTNNTWEVKGTAVCPIESTLHWSRITKDFSFSAAVSKVRVKLNNRIAGSVSRSIEFACIQLEIGKQITPWGVRSDDSYPYMTRSTNCPIFVSGETASATYVENTEDFWNNSYPMRSSHVAQETANEDAITTAGRFPVSDFFGKTYYYTYFMNGSYLRFRDSESTEDYVRDFYLAFRNEEGKYKIKDGFTIEAATHFAEKLWVVARVADVSGTTIRGLYVFEPRFPWPAPTYIECIAGCRLPTNIPLQTAVNRIEFRNEDRQHLFVFIPGSLFIVRLYYDLFALNVRERRVLLREQYGRLGIY